MNSANRIPIIDLLRGTSCLGVLLYHVRVDLWVGWWKIKHFPNEFSQSEKLLAWLSVPSPFLGYAILLFFLISGFCIHYPNTKGVSEPNWKAYFIRRFLRIYPTYFIALLLTSSISLLCHFLWDDKTWDIGRIFRVATLSQNYPPDEGQLLCNPSLWTIPLEIEFYILYPIVFLLFSRSLTWLLAILSIGISSGSVLLQSQGILWPAFTAAFLWPTWLLGAWIAELYRKEKLSNLKIYQLVMPSLIFLILAITSRIENWASWSQYTSWTGFYFFFFLFSLTYSKLIYSILGPNLFRALSWLGKISFSLYLIHFPLFRLFGYLHFEAIGEKPANFSVTILFLIPVIFLAWIFYNLIEKPVHKWSKKIANDR